ncbi:MAG: cystathionine gamma-synthase [Bacteroidetes bacterium SW_9_63_38]|nr:MAG: cystathionine gamma-synthase [Bacteroidetes bacterium SW_9_63_38]
MPDGTLDPSISLSDLHDGFGTRAVHAGQQPDPATGAVMTPIYQTSTFAQTAPDEHNEYGYSRVANPTRTALEGNLAGLEDARHGIAFSSGVAGIDAIMRSLRPGDHVVATKDLYGGTYRLMTEVFEPLDIEVSFVEMDDPDAVATHFTADTELLWVETPTNPLLRIADVVALSERAHAHEVDVVVDNTFASPFLQRPLEMGADLVVHSATKYLGGHSDVILGAVCTNSDAWAERLRFQAKSTGATPGPMDSFLVLRGTKTLHLRMERHCDNARALATILDEHPAVGRVRYPGLLSHPSHELAAAQMHDFGGMISFELADDDTKAALDVLEATELFTLAESLGGVESLIEHPATMTHASIPAEEREEIGLSDSLIRLSVGVETLDDLAADLRQALDGLEDGEGTA